MDNYEYELVCRILKELQSLLLPTHCIGFSQSDIRTLEAAEVILNYHKENEERLHRT